MTAPAENATGQIVDYVLRAKSSDLPAAVRKEGTPIEPMGPFEDDPNVTDKRFPGNPTQSYRTRHPLRIVAELESWPGHAPEVVKSMLDHLGQLREQGLNVIED